MDSTGRIHKLTRLEAILGEEERRNATKRQLEELRAQVEREGHGPLVVIPAKEVEQLRAATPEERRAWHARKVASKAERKRQRAARKEQRRR
jgi:hypothetical protein